MSGYFKIENFLSTSEIETLLVASERSGWESGRRGTGYEKLPLRHESSLQDLIRKSLQALGWKTDNDYFDAFLIRYPNGTAIPPHTDDALPGKRHQRLNAIVKAATAGGLLYLSGSMVELKCGEALIFFPDTTEHEVTVVTGERLVWSVGQLI